MSMQLFMIWLLQIKLLILDMKGVVEVVPLDKSKSIPMEEDKKPISSYKAIIEVQFCTNCDAHLFTVKHQQAKYLNHFQILKKKFQEVNICVRKKAAPSNLYKKSPYCPSNVYYEIGTNKIVYFPEIGSFEVYFQGKKIFSKIQSIKWPTFEGILQEVQSKSNSEEKQAQQKKQEQGQNISKTQRPARINEIQVKQAYEIQARKTYRIKGKNQQHLLFRYSIDRRNLFKKPQKNYLNRKSMTARNQINSNSQNHNRLDITQINQKHINNDQEGIQISPQSHKELTDQMVMKIYRKKDTRIPNDIEDKVRNSQNNPSLRKINSKNLGYNVYLQPIFPKTSVNLENYTKNKLFMANKIHEQRKNYEVLKQQAEIQAKKQKLFPHNIKINQEINGLFKQREAKPNKQLRKIKEATEQNDKKDTEHHSEKRKQTIKQNTNQHKRKSSKQQEGNLKKEQKRKTIQLIHKQPKEQVIPIQNQKQQIVQQKKVAQTQNTKTKQISSKHQQAKIQKIQQAKNNEQKYNQKQSIIKQQVPSQVNINNIATTKTIQGQTQKKIANEGQKKQQENYEEQFQVQEKQKLGQKNQEPQIITKTDQKEQPIKQNEINNLDNYEDQQFDEPQDIENKQDLKLVENDPPKKQQDKMEGNNHENEASKAPKIIEQSKKTIEQQGIK